MIGMILRLYLVVFTAGTSDVGIWQEHAAGVQNLCLIGYYHANEYMNHPPFIAVAEACLRQVADFTGIPFRILLRLPFALLDAGIALLLLDLLWPKPWRFVAVAGYWLNPLAIIFSAYHGNTDTAVAFSVLLCVWLLKKGSMISAGMALGAGFWIKLPGVLAIPALLFFIPGWRKRLAFLIAVGITALSTYLPAFVLDARIVLANVFGYQGQILQTMAGVPVWGVRALVFSFSTSPDKWLADHTATVGFFVEHGWTIALVFLLLLAWLRRSCRSVDEVCVTIAASYTFLYGFSNNWAFQYFTWSVPFWFFLRPSFFIPATLLAGGYIYSLYWLVCGNPWLSGEWNFAGHPYWPPVVIAFRNLAILFFFVSAWGFLISAVRRHMADGLKPPRKCSPEDQQPDSGALAATRLTDSIQSGPGPKADQRNGRHPAH